MKRIVHRLVQNIESSILMNTDILDWGAPVPVFGDLKKSKVATVGLNPSNLEFVDNEGNELDGEYRRFHTLGSLNIKKWKLANDEHINKIIYSYKNYFYDNPYDRWFKSLDVILRDINYSYYDKEKIACHIDIVPYATKTKWGDLNSIQKNKLVSTSKIYLAEMILSSPMEVLILNGASVVSLFSDLSGIDFEKKEMPAWELCKNSKRKVKGYSFSGKINRILDFDLKKEILVLGFNHNIQSSFGVTNKVKASIGSWIKSKVKESIFEYQR